MANPEGLRRMKMNRPMPTPTRLCYFNITGLGEPVRFLLAYCGEKFIDERLTKEEFTVRKDQFPYGKVPYLEIDGLFLHQTMAICRYLAQKHGLTGSTAVQAIEADIMADTVNDVRGGLAKYFYEQDATIKENLKETTMKNADYYLDRLESAVKYNGGYLVKDQTTWADLVLGSLSLYMNHMAGKDLFADRPALKTLRDKILSLPNIKTYLDNRPEHPF